MLISIITPTRNRASTYLPFTAESVHVQHIPDGWEIEHVICDDASDPGEQEALDELVANFSSVRLVWHDEPQGVAAARNTALVAARGDIIMDLDDDDLLFQDAVVRRVEALLASGRSWLCGDAITIDEAGHYRVGHDLPPLEPGYFQSREGAMDGFLNLEIFAYASSRAYLRETLETAGGWNCRYPAAEDYEHWLRLTALTGPPFYLQQPTFAWRYKEHSLGIDNQRSGLIAKWELIAQEAWRDWAEKACGHAR